MKLNLLIASFIFASCTLSSCAQSKSGSCEVGAEEVMKALQSKKIEILDVRTSGEYKSGHVPFSTNIDYYAKNFKEQVLELDKDKTYYLYCKTGVRSGRAQRMMLSNGFDSVCNVNGGILKLLREGVDIEKE